MSTIGLFIVYMLVVSMIITMANIFMSTMNRDEKLVFIIVLILLFLSLVNTS